MKNQNFFARMIQLFIVLTLIVTPWVLAGQDSDLEDTVQQLREKADTENRAIIAALRQGGERVGAVAR